MALSTAECPTSSKPRNIADAPEIPSAAMRPPPKIQNADLGGWAPDVLAEIDGDIALAIETDVEATKDPLSATMATFRRTVCRAFNLDDSDRSEACQIKRGVAGAVMCIYDRCADEGRSDLLSAKLFVLLFDGRYRSHGGNLFEYGNGSWQRASCISAPALQYATDSIRYAQSVFTLMTTGDLPNRDFDGVGESARRILDTKTIHDLREIALLGKPDRKPAWTYNCAELCSALFKSFSERDQALLINFHKRGSSPMPEKRRGIAFADCYWLIEGDISAQSRKSCHANCYVSVPASLSFNPPTEAVRRMRRFLATTFSGSGEGLRILLATQSLAAGAEILPDVMLFFIGPGGDGKSLLNVTLASAIWGTGFGCCPCSMLQVEEEFRRQGHKYLEKTWLSFDECRPNNGIQEEVFKNFIAGGTLPLRRNHEAETHHGSWPRSGRCWNMNDGDIPYISTAEENTFARRIRCVSMRSKMVFAAADSDENNRIFAADPSLRDWLASPEASVVYWKYILLPFNRRYTASECRAAIESPGHEVAANTEWLLGRMARRKLHTPTNPDKDANEAAPNDASRVIVMEKHAVLRARDAQQELFPEYMINKFPAPSNYGVQSRTAQRVDAGTKRRATEAETRQEVLDKCIADFPYLIKKEDTKVTSGKQRCHYRIRFLDIGAFEKLMCLRGAPSGAQSKEEVFGSWEDWGPSWCNAHARMVDFNADQPLGSLVGAQTNEGPIDTTDSEHQGDTCYNCDEIIDSDALQAYVARGSDKRMEQLRSYVGLVQMDGRNIGGGFSSISQTYVKKTVSNMKYGRCYGRYLSLRNLPKEARYIAMGENYREIDIENAHATLLLMMCNDMHVPCAMIRKYSKYAHQRRAVVAEYYNIPPPHAKKLLACALYGFCFSVCREKGIIPFVESLAAECALAMREICRKNQNLVSYFASDGREHPDRTTYAYVLGEAEDRVLRSIVSFLPQAGFRLICPIFDGAIIAPANSNGKGDVEKIRKYAYEHHGVVISTSDPKPGRLNEPVGATLPERRLALVGSNLTPLDMGSRILLKVGSNMCLPYAIVSLFPDASDVVDYACGKKDGPYTLQEIMGECAGLYVDTDDVPFSEAGAYVAILPPDRCSLRHAVGINLKIGGDFVVFDSSQSSPKTFHPPCTPARIFAGAAVFSISYGGARNTSTRFAADRISRTPSPEIAQQCGYRRAPKGRLLTDLELCTECGSALSAPVGKICAAQIWNGASWESVEHDARRCRECRIYFRPNFEWVNQKKINTCASITGNPTILLTSTLGFTGNYLRHFAHRSFRVPQSCLSEACSILLTFPDRKLSEEKLARHLLTGVLVVLRIKEGLVSFNVDDPVPEDDEIYGMPNAGYFTIFSAGRDDRGFRKSGKRSIVVDGNQVMRRAVTCPQELSLKKRTPGRPRRPRKGPHGSRAAAATTSRCNAVDNEERIKIPRRVTGGVFGAVDMSPPYEILHLGEMLNGERTSYKESRVADVGSFCKIGTLCHDCACEIRDLFVGTRRFCDRCLLDRFHASKHKCSRVLYDPDHSRNKRWVKGMNTVACEQLWSRMDHLYHITQCRRARYRYLLRHYCIWGNEFLWHRGRFARDVNPNVTRKSILKKR